MCKFIRIAGKLNNRYNMFVFKDIKFKAVSTRQYCVNLYFDQLRVSIKLYVMAPVAWIATDQPKHLAIPCTHGIAVTAGTV